MLDTALFWRSQGISTVPLYYRSKKPHCRSLVRSGLIKPNGQATWLPLKERLPTTEEISTWFRPGQKYNLALITTENLIVLDFDDMHDYGRWYCWQLEYRPAITETYMVQTGRGLHLYYRVQQSFDPIIGGPYEVKSQGRLVTTPPSVHANGSPYQPLNSPDEILTIEKISEVLNFEPVKLRMPVLSSSPWQPRPPKMLDRVDLLKLFPEAKPTEPSGRYWLIDCPLHGHKDNFWLDTELNICGCFAGCGQFLASEIGRLRHKQV